MYPLKVIAALLILWALLAPTVIVSAKRELFGGSMPYDLEDDL